MWVLVLRVLRLLYALSAPGQLRTAQCGLLNAPCHSALLHCAQNAGPVLLLRALHQLVGLHCQRHEHSALLLIK
jgi:hypothetical protein